MERSEHRSNEVRGQIAAVSSTNGVFWEPVYTQS